jgi:hypothetical protein
VEDQKRAQNHHRVPNAEHVRSRPAVGDGEHVTQKAEVGVANEIGVGEFSGGRIKAGPAQGAGRRRHHASVRRDRDVVQKPAHGNHPHEPDVEVPQDASGDEAVRGEVREAMERLVPVRDDRDEHDLNREGGPREPQAAQANRLQAAQPSSRHRDRDEQQEEGQQEGHL